MLVSQSCPTLWDPVDYSLLGNSVHGILQARNTGVDSHSLLQWIFLTQGSNLDLLRYDLNFYKSGFLFGGSPSQQTPGACHHSSDISVSGMYYRLILQVMGSMARDLTLSGNGIWFLLMFHHNNALSVFVNNAQNGTDILGKYLISSKRK